jgi:hypothetical protein
MAIECRSVIEGGGHGEFLFREVVICYANGNRRVWVGRCPWRAILATTIEIFPEMYMSYVDCRSHQTVVGQFPPVNLGLPHKTEYKAH